MALVATRAMGATTPVDAIRRFHFRPEAKSRLRVGHLTDVEQEGMHKCQTTIGRRSAGISQFGDDFWGGNAGIYELVSLWKAIVRGVSKPFLLGS